MFSMNLLNSVTKILYFQKIIQTSDLLCERSRCYHSASKTHVAEWIFKLSPIHASVIYKILWICWISDPFRENSNGFLSFTSGVTPADLFVASMVDGPFKPMYLHTYKHWWGSSPRSVIVDNSFMPWNEIKGLKRWMARTCYLHRFLM